MTLPRHNGSLYAVESALLSQPHSMRQLREATGYTEPTIRLALQKLNATSSDTKPKLYSLDTVRGPNKPHVVLAVEPIAIPTEEVGPRWKAGAQKIGQEIAAIDLETLTLQEAIEHLEVEAASILGIIVALRQVEDAPDWRAQIGLG